MNLPVSVLTGLLALGSLAGEHPEASNHLKEKPKLVQQLLQLHQDWVEETRPR